MADLKKSFDEVKEAASGFAGNNLMTSLQKDVSDALASMRWTSRPRPQTAAVAESPRLQANAGDADHAGSADARDLRGSRGACGRERAARDHPRGRSRRSAAGHCAAPRPSRTPKRHERRRYRGQQSPADGPSDRAALAADQGAARLRHRLHLLLLLRQADLQRAGLAVRLGRGSREFEIHLHGAAGIFHHPAQARAVRRRLHLVPDRRDADLQVRRARASTSTRAAPSCRIWSRPRSSSCWARRWSISWCCRCWSASRSACSRPAATRPRRSSCCPRSANICR